MCWLLTAVVLVKERRRRFEVMSIHGGEQPSDLVHQYSDLAGDPVSAPLLNVSAALLDGQSNDVATPTVRQ
ncbi:hypothetical protein GCM10022236_42610 [Microlunatus ginsengisoli]|uniref:Uncharacterized protein n=1 Tax=Microlunatus ginsengisoli TaxID=363863 RepID=A0ABP7AM74_9ACTN